MSLRRIAGDSIPSLKLSHILMKFGSACGYLMQDSCSFHWLRDRGYPLQSVGRGFKAASFPVDQLPSINLVVSLTPQALPNYMTSFGTVAKPFLCGISTSALMLCNDLFSYWLDFEARRDS